MKRKFFSEIGAAMLVGVGVFGWIFGQSPSPEQQRAVKPARQPVAEHQVGKRGDQIPSVVRQSAKQSRISAEPVALATPVEALLPSGNVLEVTAISLKMRSGPSPQNDLINVYSRGSTFEQIGQSGKWLQVRNIKDGTSGWMYADYLQIAN